MDVDVDVGPTPASLRHGSAGRHHGSRPPPWRNSDSDLAIPSSCADGAWPGQGGLLAIGFRRTERIKTEFAARITPTFTRRKQAYARSAGRHKYGTCVDYGSAILGAWYAMYKTWRSCQMMVVVDGLCAMTADVPVSINGGTSRAACDV